MDFLEKKKKEVELAKIRAALLDMEYRKLQHLEDIKRVDESMEIQKQRIEELENEIKGR